MRAASVRPNSANELHGRQSPSRRSPYLHELAHVRLGSASNLARQLAGSHAPLTSRLPLHSFRFSWLAQSARLAPSDFQATRTRCAPLALTRTSPLPLLHRLRYCHFTGNHASARPCRLSGSRHALTTDPRISNAPFGVRSVVPAALAVSFTPHFLGYRTYRESHGRSGAVLRAGVSQHVTRSRVALALPNPHSSPFRCASVQKDSAPLTERNRKAPGLLPEPSGFGLWAAKGHSQPSTFTNSPFLSLR